MKAPLLGKAPARLGIGLLHVVLAAAVAFVLVETRSQSWPVGVYPAIGLALTFGILVLVGRPRSILTESLFGILVDSLAISLLVGATGGERSPFFALYLLAALGVSRAPDVVRGIVGSAFLVGGYLAAAASGGAFGMSLSPAVGFETLLLLCSCAAAVALGARLRNTDDSSQRVISALDHEQRYVGKAEALFAGVGPLLETLSQESIVRWTARTAREALGVPYAHVATLDGIFHGTSAADGNVYPGWWHPEIQSLLLKSCRTGEIARGDTPVHGMEKFVAVPLSPEGSGSIGAIILGGKTFSAGEERTIELLAGRVTPALGRADETHGGRDFVSGVPNRDSLNRVMRRELSRSGPLTLFMVDLDLSSRHTRGTKNFLLRQIAQELQGLHQYVFRAEEDVFVTFSNGANVKKAAEAALEIRRVADRITGGPESDWDRHKTASVGFVTTGEGQSESSLLLDSVSEALARAKNNPNRIAGGLAGGEKSQVSREVEAFAEAIEIRDPDLGAHSRAVSRLAATIGSKMALSEEEMNTLVTGALLHDIGKIGIADNILYKPASLNAEEYKTMRRHPLLGIRILSSIPELSYALPAVKHHHERHDGEGYPDGLRGEHIPLAARIVSVADAMDTLMRDRPYRHGRAEKEALREIVRNSGTQFDPKVVRALQEVTAQPDIRKISS